jgi:hypothetical protein
MDKQARQIDEANFPSRSSSIGEGNQISVEWKRYE